MTIDYKVSEEKLQYNINKEATKYLTGKEIIPPDQRIVKNIVENHT